MAATMRIMRVVSCTASQARRKKLFGGLGGITLEPKTCFRRSRSFIDIPVHQTMFFVAYGLISINATKRSIYRGLFTYTEVAKTQHILHIKYHRQDAQRAELKVELYSQGRESTNIDVL